MRTEMIIGIAIEILGTGTGIGLQVTGFVDLLFGWIIIGISTVSGLFLIGYGIGKRKGNSEQSELRKSPVNMDVKPRNGTIESVTKGDMAFISSLSISMQLDHGHLDIQGLVADRASGVPLNELITRNCSRCGVLCNQKGRDIYTDE